jgi:hypothetical protein
MNDGSHGFGEMVALGIKQRERGTRIPIDFLTEREEPA